MYCMKCGKKLEGSPKFCPYCGQRLTHSSRPETEASAHPPRPTGAPPSPARQRRTVRASRWLVTSGLVLLALMLSCVLVAGGAYFLLGMHRQNQAAKIVPEETGAFVCISPTLLQLPQLRNADNALDSGAMVAALPGVSDAAEVLQQNLPADFDLDLRQDVLPWIGREVSLAVVPREYSSPSLIMTAVTRNRDASNAFLEELRSEMEEQGVEFDENTYRGIQVTEITSYSGSPLAYATVNGMVVVASDGETLRASIDAAEEGHASTLYGRKDFRKVLKDLPANRMGYIYLDWSSLMGPTLDELEEAAGIPLGPEVVEDTALAMSLRKDGLRFDFRTQFDTRSLSGVESDWLSQSANPRKVADAAPDESILYLSGQNLPLALESFAGLGLYEIFEEIEYETGVDLEDDILDELRGEYAWVVAPDRRGLWGDEMTPIGLLLLVEVDNRRQFQEDLEDAADSLTMAGGVYAYDDRVDGVPVWFLQDDYGEVIIGYGFVDDFIFFASSREMVELAVEGRASPLSDCRLFQTAVRHLPGKLRGHAYVDVERALTTIYRTMDDFDRGEFNEQIRPYVESIRAVSMGTKPMNNKGVLEGALFVCTD